MKLTSVPAEAWAALAALAGFATFIGKKLASRRRPKPEYITRAEFQKGLDTTRDRIAAGYLALNDKLDANHRELLAKFDIFESRLDRLDTAVARLDERTIVR